jgi:hypothetical protein
LHEIKIAVIEVHNFERWKVLFIYFDNRRIMSFYRNINESYQYDRCDYTDNGNKYDFACFHFLSELLVLSK